MSGSLHDPLAKLARASSHSAAVSDLLASSGGGNIHRVRQEVSADGRQFRFYLGEMPSLDSDLLGATIGDCLFNLRAALDHLAFQLHVRRFRGRVPAEIEKTSIFPRWHKPPSASERWGKIAALGTEQKTAIKHLQPYVSRNDGWFDTRRVLGTLDLLNDIDKHRHLHVARRMPTGFAVPQVPSDCGLVWESSGEPLESYGEVARWTDTKYVPANASEQVEAHRGAHRPLR